MLSSHPHTDSSIVYSCKQQQQAEQKKQEEAEMWGSSRQTRTHLRMRTRIVAQNRYNVHGL